MLFKRLSIKSILIISIFTMGILLYSVSTWAFESIPYFVNNANILQGDCFSINPATVPLIKDNLIIGGYGDETYHYKTATGDNKEDRAYYTGDIIIPFDNNGVKLSYIGSDYDNYGVKEEINTYLLSLGRQVNPHLTFGLAYRYEDESYEYSGLESDDDYSYGEGGILYTTSSDIVPVSADFGLMIGGIALNSEAKDRYKDDTYNFERQLDYYKAGFNLHLRPVTYSELEQVVSPFLLLTLSFNYKYIPSFLNSDDGHEFAYGGSAEFIGTKTDLKFTASFTRGERIVDIETPLMSGVSFYHFRPAFQEYGWEDGNRVSSSPDVIEFGVLLTPDKNFPVSLFGRVFRFESCDHYYLDSNLYLGGLIYQF